MEVATSMLIRSAGAAALLGGVAWVVKAGATIITDDQLVAGLGWMAIGIALCSTQMRSAT